MKFFKNGDRVRFNWTRERDGAYYRGTGTVVDDTTGIFGMYEVKPDEDTLESYDPDGFEPREDGLAVLFQNNMEPLDE